MRVMRKSRRRDADSRTAVRVLIFPDGARAARTGSG